MIILGYFATGSQSRQKEEWKECGPEAFAFEELEILKPLDDPNYTKEIAADGLATGSFYRYFRNKKSIFLAVCSRMETGMQDNIFGYGRTLRARGLSQRDILEAVVNQAVQAHFFLAYGG